MGGKLEVQTITGSQAGTTGSTGGVGGNWVSLVRGGVAGRGVGGGIAFVRRGERGGYVP